VGYTRKSSYPGITPEIAASGVDEALKVLEGRWKLIVLFYLFRDGTIGTGCRWQWSMADERVGAVRIVVGFRASGYYS
jgi:hypothetical protein